MHFFKLFKLFLREHNRIARKLYKENPHWGDEMLFQQSRKLVNGIYQKFVYADFLPLLLGADAVKVFNLQPLVDGYLPKSLTYGNVLYPQIYNEFGTAAFRLHTLVQNELSKASRSLRKTSEFDLSSAMYNVSDSYFHVDENARGTLLETTYAMNPQLADSLNNHLFEGVEKPVENFSGKARSLGAINIQRGREHGIRPYNHYRELAGLNEAKDFDDLLTNIFPHHVAKLKEFYQNVDDIDLFVGGVSESPLPGAKVGATFASRFFFFTGSRGSGKYIFVSARNPILILFFFKLTFLNSSFNLKRPNSFKSSKKYNQSPKKV